MNKACVRILLIPVLVLILGAGATAETERAPTPLVSLVQLIATPEKYDGKVVQVVGFLRLEFEGNALYLHEADYRNLITKNGVWVNRNAEIDKKADQINLHYVIMLGTFDAHNTGHMGLFNGAITKVTAVIPWPPEAPTHRR